VVPSNLYRVPIWTPINNTISPQTILQVSFSNIVFTPASSIFLTKIKCLANSGMGITPGSVLILPSMIFNLNFPHHMILDFDSSLRKTSPMRIHMKGCTWVNQPCLMICMCSWRIQVHISSFFYGYLFFYRRGIFISLPSLNNIGYTMLLVVPLFSTFPTYLYKFSGRFRSSPRLRSLTWCNVPHPNPL